ncbi:MAG: VOC family protein [Proteobacteria bacterium]|nr:VOC family protein [Pseudomonadota bacterium]
MIDHVSISVADLARATRFYDAVLAPLGYRRERTRPDHVGYGKPDDPVFWIEQRAAHRTELSGHYAFAAPDRPAVDAFHRAALAGGAQDNGAPGLRHYHEHYYAAFVIDPDGHRIEAVCRRPA